LAIEAVFDGEDEQAGEQHEGAHDVVAEVEAAGRGLDPGHHIRADPAADVATAIDERDRGCGRRACEERGRDCPPDAHGGMDADG